MSRKPRGKCLGYPLAGGIPLGSRQPGSSKPCCPSESHNWNTGQSSLQLLFLILTQTALGVSQITGGGMSWLIQGLLISLLKQYQYKIKRSNRKVETMVKDDTVQLEGRTYPCRKVTREDCRKDADRSRASRPLSLVYYRRRISVRVRRVPYPAMPQSAQVVTYKTQKASVGGVASVNR